MEKKKRVSFGMSLVTIGIVYGDIGTSPLYVMKSILKGNGGIAHVNEDFILGALSLIIWTITLLTTVKYVLIAMRADNNGEGGIFSLYALVKKVAPWLIFPAMIGGAALLADGVLTPAVTVTTAVEGLRSIPAMNRFLGSGQARVVLITLVIISTLFAVQWAGTSKIGKAFGPVMLVWFSFLGIMGLLHVFDRPGVLRAFNPVYAARILVSPYNKAGFMILGSVFLATTGAEALYSDMGHVGRGNIYASWPFVKACLILNYLGQGAWILTHTASGTLAAIPDMNPFFQMLPEALRAPAVALGALAAIIASQALITGSYTLVSEAIRLDLMPHLEVRYPSDTKGQIYIGAVNTVLYLGCAAVVLYFRTSAQGGGLRSCHHRDDAYDDAPSRGVSLEHPEKAGTRGRHRARVRRDRGSVLPLVAEQIRPRRVCRGAHGARALSHHGRMAARHAARAGVRHTPAGRRLSPESRYAP